MVCSRRLHEYEKADVHTPSRSMSRFPKVRGCRQNIFVYILLKVCAFSKNLY